MSDKGYKNNNNTDIKFTWTVTVYLNHGDRLGENGDNAYIRKIYHDNSTYIYIYINNADKIGVSSERSGPEGDIHLKLSWINKDEVQEEDNNGEANDDD